MSHDLHATPQRADLAPRPTSPSARSGSSGADGYCADCRRAGGAIAALGERLATRDLGLSGSPIRPRSHGPATGSRSSATSRGTARDDVLRRAVRTARGARRGHRGRRRILAEGCVIAPLDLHRSMATMPTPGRPRGCTVVVLFTALRGGPCHRSPSSAVRAGRGLDGDRYADRGGHVLAPGAARTGPDADRGESLDELSEPRASSCRWPPPPQRRHARRSPERARRAPLHDGQRPLHGSRLAEACAHLQRLTTPACFRGLVHRGNIHNDVLDDGESSASATPIRRVNRDRRVRMALDWRTRLPGTA